MQATGEFLDCALVLATEPPNHKTRMEAFLKWRYGKDFISMTGFYEVRPMRPGNIPYFHYAARAVIKAPDWEVT